MTTLTGKMAGIIGLAGTALILLSIEFAAAQQSKLTGDIGDITKKEWFQKMQPRVRALADSAVRLANEPKYEESIKILEELLAMPETQKANRFFRAWLYQWMAYNFYTPETLDTTRFFVRRSLDADFDIWPDQVDRRLPTDVRGMYQEYREEILDRFRRKHKSWRIALGTISRIDYSHRFTENWDAVAGIGSTVVLSINGKTQVFNDLLPHLRVQYMRKNIGRLTAGFYGEFSLLFRLDEKNEWKRPDKAVSFGPILSYAYQSGWEIGGTFEIARLVIGDSETRISQTISLFNDDKFSFSYANFEFYIRKWF